MSPLQTQLHPPKLPAMVVDQADIVCGGAFDVQPRNQSTKPFETVNLSEEFMVSVAEHALRASLAPKESDEGGRGGAG